MRLVLLCHAATAATRAARFPDDEPLARDAAPRLARLVPAWPARARAFTSPARRAWDTAAALGLAAGIEPALRDLDHGGWTGLALADVAVAEPDALAAWLADPSGAPPGGESGAALQERVAAWLDGQREAAGAVVAVTHAAVIRAAVALVLGAGPPAWRTVEVAPLATATFSSDGRRWTLRALRPP